MNTRLYSLLIWGSLLHLQCVSGRSVADEFTVRGVSIHYVDQGAGSPVVLIHGLHSSVEMNWRLPGILDRLAKDYRVIALDLPGHGRSDKPDAAEAYGEKLAEDVILLLDHLNIERVDVVGYSMGGMVAMNLLVRHPDRVHKAVVGGMGWMRQGSFLAKSWERMQPREGSRTPSVCIQSLGKLALTEDEVKSIRTPVLILVGDRDPVKRMYVAPLQRVQPGWQVIEIADAGHLTCIMKQQFSDAIVDWLNLRNEP